MQESILYSRIKRVLSLCDGVDKILIANTNGMDPNFLYFTGFASGLFEYSYLILGNEGAKLITSKLEYETAKEQAVPGLEVLNFDEYEQGRRFVEAELSGKTIGINGAFLPYNSYNSIEERYRPGRLVDISRSLAQARLVKDDEEIGSIRKAVNITKWAMVLIQKELKEGVTEIEIASKFDSISGSLGSKEPSFSTIVCFGKNAALPHHSPDSTTLKYGDIVLIDAGAKINNYCSDITRTIIFGDDKEKIDDYIRKEDMIRTVKEAQLAAIRAIKAGVKGKVIHNIASEYIDTARGGVYKGTFIHSLGHSVGLEVHDGPGFSPLAEQEVEKNMVITVEPGIYLPGFGGARIEDDVLITENGAEVL